MKNSDKKKNSWLEKGQSNTPINSLEKYIRVHDPINLNSGVMGVVLCVCRLKSHPNLLKCKQSN